MYVTVGEKSADDKWATTAEEEYNTPVGEKSLDDKWATTAEEECKTPYLWQHYADILTASE